MSRCRKSLALAALLVTFALSAFGGPPPKPDFSGKWVLNAAKSDFGQIPPPKSRVDDIKQKDAHLALVRTQLSSVGSTVTLTLDCTIGGGDCVSTNSEKEVQVKTRASWDGDVLVFNLTVTTPDGEVTTLDRFTRSADGKTITVQRHLTVAGIELDQTLVLEKQ